MGYPQGYAQFLLQLAQRDPLTGIYNKSATNALVERRMEDFDFTVLQALLIVDIDFFKTVNDTYGHMVGDNIISAVAEQLKTHVRSSDVVGRIGGDEFLVYLPDVENEDAALYLRKDMGRNGVTVYDKQACNSESTPGKPAMQKEESK